MRAAQLPNGDYYIEKTKTTDITPFTFRAKYHKKAAAVNIGLVVVPEKMVGKRLMFKMEVVEDDLDKHNADGTKGYN